MDRDKISNRYKGPSIDASYQVSVHLAEGFQRRRLKCEKLTDRRRTPSDGKSSHCLWQGELKNDLRSLFWRSQKYYTSTWTFTKMTYDLYLDLHTNSTQHRLELSQKMTYNLYLDCHQKYLAIFPQTIMKIALRFSFAQRKAMKIIKVLVPQSECT